MKLAVYSFNTQVGILEKTEKGYSYSSIIENEEKLLNSSFTFKYSDYTLFNSINIKIKCFY